MPKRSLEWPRPPKLTRRESIIIGLVIWQVTEFVRVALDSVMHGLAFITFYPALVLAAYVSGFEGGLIVLAGALTVGWFTWLTPFSTHPRMFDTVVISLMFSAAGLLVVVAVAGLRQAVLDLAERDEQARVINRELMHRLRNAFTVVATLTSQVFQRAGVDPELTEAVSARIRALARAEEVVSLEAREGSPLLVLAERVLGPIVPERSRLLTQGEAVRIPRNIAGRLALVLHELGTNALKYGAWSTGSGQVALSWQVNAASLSIRWQESGGPPAIETDKRGLGSALLEQAIAGAKVEREFRPSGLTVRLSLPCGSAS